MKTLTIKREFTVTTAIEVPDGMTPEQILAAAEDALQHQCDEGGYQWTGVTTIEDEDTGIEYDADTGEMAAW